MVTSNVDAVYGGHVGNVDIDIAIGDKTYMHHLFQAYRIMWHTQLLGCNLGIYLFVNNIQCI